MKNSITMTLFDNQYSKQKIYFGQGVRDTLIKIIKESEFERPCVISSAGVELDRAHEIHQRMGLMGSSIYTNAQMHTPISTTNELLALVNKQHTDCLIAVGGGTSIGLSKAIALRTGLQQFVLPTTYAGSEATNILGQTENGIKTTLRDDKVLPHSVFYDAQLVTSLPQSVTVTSALNAIAHAVEALYASNRTAETTSLAQLGIASFAKSLKTVVAEPDNLKHRQETQKGAWACGTVLSRVDMALHHKLCHVLGGSFDLPHAQTHAVILPHAIAYNEAVVADLLKPVKEFFKGSSAASAVWHLAKELGAPMSLQALGLNKQNLEKAAAIATAKPYCNPRPIDSDAMLTLLERAFEGSEPKTNSY